MKQPDTSALRERLAGYTSEQDIQELDGLTEKINGQINGLHNLLDEIKAESDKKTYILVAHNGIARVVQSYFTDMTNEEYAAFGVKNCAVVRYDFK